MIVKADNSKAIVIINELEKKIDNFIQENNIKQLNKDPTDMYQKQIQQALQKCNALVNKQIRSKYKTYSPETEHIHKNAQRQ